MDFITQQARTTTHFKINSCQNSVEPLFIRGLPQQNPFESFLHVEPKSTHQESHPATIRPYSHGFPATYFSHCILKIPGTKLHHVRIILTYEEMLKLSYDAQLD